MDVKFRKSTCPCLDTAVREVRNTEQTQEIRLTEGMPDIGQILCAWGQIVLRGKEWERDSIRFSGGLMVWVLYAPEDGSGETCVEGWIPFQMNWDLPENTREGIIRIQPVLRSLDARSVSARKMLVRAGVGAMAEAFVQAEPELAVPEENPDVELLRSRYPLTLPKEAGEKTFLLDEELTLPDSMPAMEKMISYRLDPKVTEKRVIGDKLAFRGSGNLHLLYQGSEGRLHSKDWELPFSQVAPLEGSYSGEAQGDLVLCPSSMELDPEEGRLRFKAGLVGQYRICDRELLELCEDAYCPGREGELERSQLQLPAILEERRENLYGEQNISADAQELADAWFLPDFPRLRRGEDGTQITAPGMVQALYYDPEGHLQASSARWEGTLDLPAEDSVQLWARPDPGELPRIQMAPGELRVQQELPMDITAVSQEGLPMVTAVKLGEKVPSDPARPSLVVRRTGEHRLWDIAKENGTTVDSIRRANGLTEEPAPDRMLLVPIP